MNVQDMEWIKFERETNKALEEKGSQYRLIYLPDKDLMPFYHLKETTELEDKFCKLEEKFEQAESKAPKTVTLSEDEVSLVGLALTIYKAVLMSVHGEMIRHPEPVKTIAWEKEYGDGTTTEMPICPNCCEPAYGMETADEHGIGQCPFCGQRYKYDDEGKKKAEPNPQETLVCPFCGNQTLVGRRSKFNGHFHGKCTTCGVQVNQ